MNPGPEDQQSHGHEYPSPTNTPTPSDEYAPVDYPTYVGQQPPQYPGPYDVGPTGFPYPGPPHDGYQQDAYQQDAYPQDAYPPAPPLPGAPYQGHPGQQYPGANPYGANPYGANPYGSNPYGYDPYRPAQPVGTNGKAIASLVTSLVGLTCCLFPGIIGIVLGVMAMRETKQTGQDGHGLALAGVIVGALAVAFGVLAVVIFALDFTFNDAYGSSYSSY